MWMSLPFEKCIQKVNTPFKLPKKEYLEHGRYPVVSQEAALISGYHNDPNHLFNVDEPVVIFGDHTQVLKYIDFSFVVGADGVKILKPIEEIDPKYLYYTLLMLMPKGSGYARHYRLLKELNICYPSLAEQQRIVAKLDEAFAEIDTVVEIENKKSSALDLLERNFLEQVFSTSHPVIKVGDLGEVKSGGTPKSTNASYWNGDIPWYSSGELNNLFTSPSEKFITVDGLNNSNAKLFPKGSLLVGMYDTAAMKMSILQEEATFNQAIVGIPPNQFASAEYLFYAMKFLKPTILLERRGVRQQNLSLAKIKEIEIPLPTRDVQHKIVERLRELGRQQSSYHHSLIQKREKYLLLKSAILAQELQPQRSEAA